LINSSTILALTLSIPDGFGNAVREMSLQSTD
jgi:hypothetical protein